MNFVQVMNFPCCSSIERVQLAIKWNSLIIVRPYPHPAASLARLIEIKKCACEKNLVDEGFGDLIPPLPRKCSEIQAIKA